LLCKT